MDILLRQVDECPLNLLLGIYCRVGESQESGVILEDLLTDLTVQATIWSAVEIPLAGSISHVQAVRRSLTELEVLDFDVITDPRMLMLLTSPMKLAMVQEQAHRYLRALKSG